MVRGGRPAARPRDIYGYDGRDLKLVKRVPLAVMPSHLAFTKDSKTLLVSLQVSGEIAAIDLPTQTVKWKMKVGKVPAGLVTPDDKYLLVGMTGADYVAVVDWRNQKVVKQIYTGKGAHNFRSLADGTHVAVTNRVANTISIIDENTLTNVGDITGLLPVDDMELSADKEDAVGDVPLREEGRDHRPGVAQAGADDRRRPLAARHLFLRPRALALRAGA